MNKYQEALNSLLPCHSICGHYDRHGNYISCDECGTKKIKDTLQELIDKYEILSNEKEVLTIHELEQELWLACQKLEELDKFICDKGYQDCYYGEGSWLRSIRNAVKEKDNA